ncbi:FAD-binding oxidoreductase [Novosphingobium panipatense]|uniref:FAD-binding oxidoreductase n=1 Tax=Novosphingobium TaxID=165696 RepID=UPI001E2BAA0A|nr:FAD-binding oxidoreductase [Novosphingobium sp. HII-3]
MDPLSATLSEPISTPALAERLAAIVGADNVCIDEAKRKLHSEDIWSNSDDVVVLVVAPANTGELAEVVKVLGDVGCSIAPRGSGMSYTSAYVPANSHTVSIDTLRMNRILAVSRADMTVTVQAGVSWVQLNEALAKEGLRTPFWGPMSGLVSTIGGGLSQLNAMFGASQYGTSSESVVALTVVTGTGEVIRTGARGEAANHPFYRHFGPDLAGIFCGDCGTLGIKAEVTFRLITAPAHEDYASFSFPSGEKLLEAMGEMSRAGIASEMCAFDPGLTEVRMKRMSLMADMKTLGAVIGKEKSLGKGLLSAARVALGGRSFIPEGDYPLHVITEGRSKEAVAFDMTEARRIARDFDGTEIENSIAKIIRANPFPPLNSMVGPTGEAWVPVHGVCPLSTAPQIFTEIQKFYAENAALFAEHEIHTGFLFTGMATNALII